MQILHAIEVIFIIASAARIIITPHLSSHLEQQQQQKELMRDVVMDIFSTLDKEGNGWLTGGKVWLTGWDKCLVWI